jgi:hypothetical protein
MIKDVHVNTPSPPLTEMEFRLALLATVAGADSYGLNVGRSIEPYEMLPSNMEHLLISCSLTLFPCYVPCYFPAHSLFRFQA